MNNFTIVPSRLNFKSAPILDSQVTIDLNQTQKELIQFVRNTSISLAQLYEDEREISETYRPTFKVDYIYDNTYTGTTDYLPFQYNLFYVDAVQSKLSGIWKGFPQYYEFDFFRPYVNDNHFVYVAQSAYTYNWTYYITHAAENDYTKNMEATYSGNTLNFQSQDGIPFVVFNSKQGGANIISFQCFMPHGLTVADYVELSLTYNGNQKVFNVFSLGDSKSNSSEYIFNLIDVGYTGTTFSNGTLGTFKRIANPDNLETKSKYYVRRNKVLANESDIYVTKTGFELNPFKNVRQYEFSSITPNNLDRVSKKTSSLNYNFTMKKDLDLNGVVDNQKRPLPEIFLSIVNKGYSGYFNKPFNNSGLKQGWFFNITKDVNSWWDDNNSYSDTNITVSSYTKTNGSTETFYYNNVLNVGDLIDGDFCEWNDYEQIERVISPYIQKIKFNQDVFKTVDSPTGNTGGYYYKVHYPTTIKVYSSYVETGVPDITEDVPNYAFYSSSDNLFRWREPYSVGEFDDNNRGVIYPFLNNAQYPFESVIFRLIPEGSNYQDIIQGVSIGAQPTIDDCE
jgi:hypothetical protein